MLLPSVVRRSKWLWSGVHCFFLAPVGKLTCLDASGCETVAHVRENGRITILFNAFEGPPDIVRLYGKGESVSLLIIES